MEAKNTKMTLLVGLVFEYSAKIQIDVFNLQINFLSIFEILCGIGL